MQYSTLVVWLDIFSVWLYIGGMSIYLFVLGSLSQRSNGQAMMMLSFIRAVASTVALATVMGFTRFVVDFPPWLETVWA